MKNYNSKFKILPHPADLKIQAYGRTKEELFSNMLKGITASQKATTLPEKVKKEIEINSPDLPSLLVDFLNEVLYLTQTNKEIYDMVEFKKLSNLKLEAELQGRKVERFGEDIKAVTYHSLDVHQEEDGTWQATVLCDI